VRVLLSSPVQVERTARESSVIPFNLATELQLVSHSCMHAFGYLFFREGNIIISQPLHRLMHIAIHYYTRAKQNHGISKTKFAWYPTIWQCVLRACGAFVGLHGSCMSVHTWYTGCTSWTHRLLHNLGGTNLPWTIPGFKETAGHWKRFCKCHIVLVLATSPMYQLLCHTRTWCEIKVIYRIYIALNVVKNKWELISSCFACL
jgi:hypothetical protein